jgi:DNA-binding CsgD family transcriptional regulator
MFTASISRRFQIGSDFQLSVAWIAICQFVNSAMLVVRGGGMRKRSALSVLLDMLYDVPGEALAWTRFLEALARDFHGTTVVSEAAAPCSLPRQDGPSGAGDETVCVTPSAVARVALWPILSTARQSVECSDDHPPRLLRCVLCTSDAFTLTLSVRRNKHEAAFSGKEVRTWEELKPHLRRVVRLCLRSTDLALGAQCAFLALGALGIGVVVATADSHLVFASAVAERVLGRPNGLGVVQGRLRVPLSIRRRFEDQLRRVASDVDDGDMLTSARQIITIEAESGTRPISILMMRVGERSAYPVPLAALFIFDPMHSINLRERDLAVAYGLTAAESRLVRELVGGVPLAGYAASAGIALNTAKSYLHQVFTKTGQSRQSDLMRMILSDPVLQMAGFELACGEHEGNERLSGPFPRDDANLGGTQQWRTKAEELRVIADEMTSTHAAESFRRLAATCDNMAERLERSVSPSARWSAS